MLRHTAIIFVVSLFCINVLGDCRGADIADFREEPLGEVPPFQKPNEDALVEAAAHLGEHLIHWMNCYLKAKVVLTGGTILTGHYLSPKQTQDRNSM